jgi:hypothetical protein
MPVAILQATTVGVTEFDFSVSGLILHSPRTGHNETAAGSLWLFMPQSALHICRGSYRWRGSLPGRPAPRRSWREKGRGSSDSRNCGGQGACARARNGIEVGIVTSDDIFAEIPSNATWILLTPLWPVSRACHVRDRRSPKLRRRPSVNGMRGQETSAQSGRQESHRPLWLALNRR